LSDRQEDFAEGDAASALITPILIQRWRVARILDARSFSEIGSHPDGLLSIFTHLMRNRLNAGLRRPGSLACVQYSSARVQYSADAFYEILEVALGRVPLKMSLASAAFAHPTNFSTVRVENGKRSEREFEETILSRYAAFRVLRGIRRKFIKIFYLSRFLAD
jgi:hypothetical protein